MGANLQLLPEEIRLITDPAWILTKNSVMGKVVALMAALSEDYRVIGEGAGASFQGDDRRLIEAAFGGGPKISRGEHYRGLPWVMLDCPRAFGKEDVLAIRTMFWWGHTFSVTLHLKGCYQQLLLPVIQARRGMLAAAGFHAGIGDDEWRHELVPENYRPLIPDEAGESMGGRRFLKLSAAIGVDQWAGAPLALTGMYRVLVDAVFGGRVAQINYQAGERDPSPGSSRAGSDL
jgi:hypothetical protein